jgi:hypothetical protein
MDKVYRNKPHTEDMKESTYNTEFSILSAKPWHVINILVICDTCLQAEENHFQHIL